MSLFNRKIKAFTFAELMVSLVIISVITVVLYPIISNLAPNNNKFLFKSTYKTIENIISDIMLTSDMPNGSNVQNNLQAACLCNEFAEKMNTLPDYNASCNGTGIVFCPNGKAYSGNGNNTLITSNGVRWAFQYDNANNRHEILVDVNPANNSNDAVAPQNTAGNPLPIGWNADLSDIWSDAKAAGGNTARGINYTDNVISQDTFLIRIQATGYNRGKITVANNVGNMHLTDTD